MEKNHESFYNRKKIVYLNFSNIIQIDIPKK